MKEAKLLLKSLLVATSLTLLGCDSGGGGTPLQPAAADSLVCDTLRVDIGDKIIDYIRCREIVVDTLDAPCDTVFTPSPPDTVVIVPDWDCVRECLEINGLGHWPRCLDVCVPAR